MLFSETIRAFKLNFVCNLLGYVSDETYRGVEIVVHTLVVGFETHLNTASCHACPISRVLKAKWPQNALESLLHTS